MRSQQPLLPLPLPTTWMCMSIGFTHAVSILPVDSVDGISRKQITLLRPAAILLNQAAFIANRSLLDATLWTIQRLSEVSSCSFRTHSVAKGNIGRRHVQQID